MSIIKIIGIIWMLIWFFVILRSCVNNFVKQPSDLSTFILTLIFAWGLFGLVPVLIVKFGAHLFK